MTAQIITARIEKFGSNIFRKHLLNGFKRVVAAYQLHCILEVTYKTAWFLAHRIREAMRSGDLDTPFGSGGGAVEVDETFIGNDRKKKPHGERYKRGYQHEHKILTLVDRDTGQARTVVVDDLKQTTLWPILRDNISAEARVMTDEAGQYVKLDREFAEHGVVRYRIHENAIGDITTNTVEGYFSVFKRGMKGTYQHCAKKHLHRYAAEFEFRYNHRSKLGVEDHARFGAALSGAVGKRLTYETTHPVR